MTAPPHPLAYPAAVTAAAVLVLALLVLGADADQAAGLAAVGLGVLGYSALRLLGALRGGRRFPADARRVRQEYRLTSRSWVEFGDGPARRWVPVYFDRGLIAAADISTLRLYPAGRARRSEPAGRLIDNPTRPDADAPLRAARAATWRRRLLLDAQSAVAAPFLGLFWLYVVGGGLPAFLGAAAAGAAAAVWLSAIQGSDPS